MRFGAGQTDPAATRRLKQIVELAAEIAIKAPQLTRFGRVTIVTTDIKV
ncbi:hypothetical protein [Rhodoplanes sp. Z2-YC6860]|nr:hypothetical protein [Rhodoplanes sp. Z2-YC6860]